MKTIKNMTQFLIVIILSLGLYSCNNTYKEKDDNSTKVKQKTEDVKNSLSIEQQNLKEEVEQTIAEFDTKIKSFKESLERSHITLAKENLAALDKLEAQREELKHELDEIADESEKNWKEFKEQVTEQTQTFKQSVNDFFTVNKEE